MALLCTLRLLQGLPAGAPALHCICFGTPAIGNAALASLVQDQKWGAHIFNFILPGDACTVGCCYRLTYRLLSLCSGKSSTLEVF